MGRIYVKDDESEKERMIFVEGEPPVRMEDAEKITMNMKGEVIYGTRNEERSTPGEAGDSED